MFWQAPKLTRFCARTGKLFVCLCLLTEPTVEAADIRVNALEDIDFGSVPPTAGDLTAETSFCVAMQPRGRYELLATGNGPAGDFTLFEAGNSARSINYSVQISDRGRSFGRALRPGVLQSNLRASRFNRNGRCQPRARLRVLVPGGQLTSAAPGRYEGTLSLTVVPE